MRRRYHFEYILNEASRQLDRRNGHMIDLAHITGHDTMTARIHTHGILWRHWRSELECAAR